MPGPWKAWKTKPRFSTLPTALENPAEPAAFSHFHRQGVHRLEKWKTQNRFPTFPPGARVDDDGSVSTPKPKTKRKEVGRYAASSFSYPALPPVERFHAHPSIRKCWRPRISAPTCATKLTLSVLGNRSIGWPFRTTRSPNLFCSRSQNRSRRPRTESKPLHVRAKS